MSRILGGWLLALWFVVSPAHAQSSADRAAFDALLARPASKARDKAIQQWADRASLPDLFCLLDRPPGELGAGEGPIVEGALRRTPAARAALRRRLLARVAIAVGEKRRFEAGEVAALAREPVMRPYASVFDVSAVLPVSGDYQSYGEMLGAGLEAGLADASAPCPIRLRRWNSGAESPARAISVFDSAAAVSAVVVGEVLSNTTLALAAAARAQGVTLISPFATDEDVGLAGGHVFQIGPSGYDRGRVLARAALAGGTKRVGILVVSSPSSLAFARGFAAAAESLGSTPVWQERYAQGNAGFRDAVRSIVSKRVELLLWDGDPREAEALLRQLTRDRVSLRICGGPALAPDQHHAEARVLLEGVEFISEEWVPNAAGGADSSAASDPVALRGRLAGHMIRDAIASGALCAEEVADHLRARVSSDAYLRDRGFLNVRALGVGLPLYTVTRGRAIPVRQ